jgi:hypothetical protein
LSRQADDDFPGVKPVDRRERPPPEDAARNAVKPGRDRRRRRRRGNTWKYVAILILLAILLGGGTAAYVENWIDLSGILPTRVADAGRARDSAELIFSGNAGALAAPAGNQVQQDKDDPRITWIRSSLRQASPAGATDGASIEIKPPLLDDLIGKRIKVTVSARAADQGPPQPFAIAYSAGDLGTSGWRVFTPSAEFDDYSFVYQVPTKVGAAHHVGIWSDISGRGAPLAVRSISIGKVE